MGWRKSLSDMIINMKEGCEAISGVNVAAEETQKMIGENASRDSIVLGLRRQRKLLDRAIVAYTLTARGLQQVVDEWERDGLPWDRPGG